MGDLDVHFSFLKIKLFHLIKIKLQSPKEK